MVKRIDVAIAIVAQGDQVLIARRRSTDPLGGFWEFPGGKCESDETPEQCLVREAREELGILIEPIHPFPVVEFDYPHARVRLHPFLCHHTAGNPTPIECEQLQWVPVDALDSYRFPPANDRLLRQIAQRLNQDSNR